MSNDSMPQVLVVDDEAMICDLFCRWLSRDGYHCRAVSSASDALAVLAEEPVALLLLDINMPEITGVEILPELKTRYPDLAILMISAVKERDVAFSALKLGADGYLSKPVSKLELLLSAANAIMRRQLDRQLRDQQQELARLVAEKTAELQTAYEALQRSHDHLLQQEKMAAIGQLAAGVAHEINNPTGFIASNLGSLGKYVDRLAEFIAWQTEAIAAHADADTVAQQTALRQRLKIDHLLADAVDLINESQEGTERVKKIVQGLKNFSRKDQDDCRLADINECLESTLDIVWNEVKYKATVSKDFGPLPVTHCFPQQLNQVFMNLLVNAAQAISGKGEIGIKTWHDQGLIHVTITDTGCGIPAENLEKVFEPFFTTKELGKGTGLGMSISAEIIKRHHGTIAVTSVVGQGTSFTVTIPVTETLVVGEGESGKR